MTTVFVNLPVTDLERAKGFYTALGFRIDPHFTDRKAACVVIEEGHSSLMILVAGVLPEHDRAARRRPGGEPASGTAIFVDGREAVDAAVVAGLAAGGSEPGTAEDSGFRYQRGLTDRDGNVVEFGWMDPVAAAQGPEAFLNQQA